jgi:hypothetical protein
MAKNQGKKKVVRGKKTQFIDKGQTLRMMFSFSLEKKWILDDGGTASLTLVSLKFFF